MSLAPAPSDRELLRMAAERQIARYGRILDPALIGTPGEASHRRVDTMSRARAVAGRESVPYAPGEAIVVQNVGLGIPTSKLVDYVVAAQTDPSYSAIIRARREGDTLYLEIETPPRTKKNGTVLGIRQTKAYARYEREIVGAVASVKAALELPLPDAEYNIAIAYYVDSYGRRADRPGLDNGLFDALEKAGVVTNDWQFRTTEGTRKPIVGDPRPRVELVISPLSSES